MAAHEEFDAPAALAGCWGLGHDLVFPDRPIPPLGDTRENEARVALDPVFGCMAGQSYEIRHLAQRERPPAHPESDVGARLMCPRFRGLVIDLALRGVLRVRVPDLPDVAVSLLEFFVRLLDA